MDFYIFKSIKYFDNILDGLLKNAKSFIRYVDANHGQEEIYN